MAVNWPASDGTIGKRERPQRIFMNKRRKSLYSEGGENGFVYRTLPRLPRGICNTVQKESADGGFTFRRMSTESSGDLNSSFETGLDEVEKEDEVLRRQVEVKSFVACLKKDLLLSGDVVNPSELDGALAQIENDLCSSDMYFRYLESSDATESENLSLSELQESVAMLKANIEMHKRELKEWDEVLQKKRTEVSEWKRDIESERDVDFRHLTPDDVEILRTYLTPEQKKLLEEVEKLPAFDSSFIEQSNSRLRKINFGINRELECIHTQCYAKLGELHAPTERREDWNEVEETPRTIFKSMKEL